MLDLKDARVVVFGGGEVGLRKASYFSREARVLVVSQKFAEGFDHIDVERIEVEAHAALSRVDSADLVIAATNDKNLNREIIERAASLNKLYNSADGDCNFTIPSVVEKENYMIAISTMGRSPAMAKFLRQKLDSELDEVYSSMVRLQEELRACAKRSMGRQQEREEYLWEILNDREVWDALRVDYSRAKELALKKMDG